MAALRGLALANLLGLVGVGTIVTSIPLYVDATYSRVLRETLADAAAGAGRSPFTLVFHYSGSLKGAVEWDDVHAADSYLSDPIASDLGLPIRSLVRFVRTQRFLLFPQGTSSYEDAQRALAGIRFGTISDIAQHHGF